MNMLKLKVDFIFWLLRNKSTLTGGGAPEGCRDTTTVPGGSLPCRSGDKEPLAVGRSWARPPRGPPSPSRRGEKQDTGEEGQSPLIGKATWPRAHSPSTWISS